MVDLFRLPFDWDRGATPTTSTSCAFPVSREKNGWTFYLLLLNRKQHLQSVRLLASNVVGLTYLRTRTVQRPFIKEYVSKHPPTCLAAHLRAMIIDVQQGHERHTREFDPQGG